ncbi:MAG: hypothetical protein ACOCP9_02055 [Halofilum sp. (in: g-proteobacteria)]
MDESYRPVSAVEMTRLELHHVDGWVAETVRVYYFVAGTSLGQAFKRFGPDIPMRSTA